MKRSTPCGGIDFGSLRALAISSQHRSSASMSLFPLCSNDFSKFLQALSTFLLILYMSFLFSHWVVSDSSWPHGPEHARPSYMSYRRPNKDLYCCSYWNLIADKYSLGIMENMLESSRKGAVMARHGNTSLPHSYCSHSSTIKAPKCHPNLF